MSGIVVFDPAAFIARYPEFTSVSSATLQLYFNEATIYLSNATNSLVTDVTIRSTLLNMATAHIAALNSGVNGQAAPQTVGRIDSATEGSVSVSLDMGAVPNSAAWWMQTKYGASYWSATRSYRTMRYFPPQQTLNGYPPPWLQ